MILATNRGLIGGFADMVTLRKYLQEQCTQTNRKASERTLMAIQTERSVLILTGLSRNKALWIEGKRLVESRSGFVRFPDTDAHQRAAGKQKVFENEILLYRTNNPFGLLKSEAFLGERLSELVRVPSGTGNPFKPYRVTGRKPRQHRSTSKLATSSRIISAIFANESFWRC